MEPDGVTDWRIERVLHLFANRLDSSSLEPEYVVPWVVTMVEGLVDQVIDDAVESSGVAKNPLGAAFLEEVKDSMHATWQSRWKWLDLCLGVSMSGGVSVQKLDVLIECRNAVMHGGGRLTDRQIRSPGKVVGLARQLRTIGMGEIQSRRIIWQPGAGRQSIRIGFDFLNDLDREIRQQRV